MHIYIRTYTLIQIYYEQEGNRTACCHVHKHTQIHTYIHTMNRKGIELLAAHVHKHTQIHIHTSIHTYII